MGEEFDIQQSALQEEALRLEAEPPQEFHVVEVRGGDGLAILADDTEIKVSEEKLAELQALFEQGSYPEGRWQEPMNKILATLSGSPDESTIDTLRITPFEEASGDPVPQDDADEQPQ